MNTNAHESERASASPDPAKAGKLAQQIVSMLINEDLATRQRAMQAAMTLLGDAPPQANSAQLHYTKDDGGGDNHDLASFFNRDGDMKPADYAYLCAAYHFSQYGAVPFSAAEIRAIAADAGVVVPDRWTRRLEPPPRAVKNYFKAPAKARSNRPQRAAWSSASGGAFDPDEK